MNKKNIILYILIFILAIFFSSLITNYDFDLFARLEVGEIFFKLHKILVHDPFSYTQTLPWTDHEWGAGVVFYAFLKLLGPAGLIILNSAMYTLAAVFILKDNKELRHPLIISSLFLTLIQYTAGDLIRCQVFTFVFAAIMLYVLEKLRKTGGTKLVWFLPIITAFWCNMHGGVISGLGIISIYCLTALIKREKFAKTLCIVAVLSFLSLFINPYGFHYPLYLYSAVTVPRNFIEDWLSIFNPRFLYTYFWIILLFVVMLGTKLCRDIKNKTFDIYHYILLLITVSFGFAHVKGIELAAIAIFMFCSSDLDDLLAKSNIFIKMEKSLYAVVIVLGLTIPFNITTPRVTFSKYPLTEVEFLKINNIKGNIFSTFELGSYISYKLYPDNKIFIDGRYDGVYPMEVFDDNTNFVIGINDWKAALEKYPTDIIILPLYFEKTIKRIKENPQLGFVDTFHGYNCCIFLKKNLVKSDYKIPSIDLQYYRDNIFKTDFTKHLKDEKYD